MPARAHPSSEPRKPADREVFWCKASVMPPDDTVCAASARQSKAESGTASNARRVGMRANVSPIRRGRQSLHPLRRSRQRVASAYPTAAVAQDGRQEEATVTGSRVVRSGFDSPQPLSVIGAEQIDRLGLVNVGDVVRTLPQNTAFFTETNVGIGNFNVGAQLANLRGLNPFFGTRTLTLIDTKRVVPTTEGG